ncbi:MAG: flagellar biosynthesis protein FlhF, partial [Spirochaetales bacterium]|nr:flagellar biosynthesis protein FlhF [Spirochaetales bacterium]
TLAKIAANVKMKEKRSVEFVTMDGYRIGAREQIERYAKLIGIKCTYTDTSEELNKTILMSKESLILIDTTGRSQQDGIKLAEMRDFLRLNINANIRPNFVLAVSATTKPKEVRNIFKNFSIFDYDQIIITKNDESDTVGSILSCAVEFKKKIMFCTNGQKVPSNIEKVSKNSLMQKITGFVPEVYLENLEF